VQTSFLYHIHYVCNVFFSSARNNPSPSPLFLLPHRNHNIILCPTFYTQHHIDRFISSSNKEAPIFSVQPTLSINHSLASPTMSSTANSINKSSLFFLKLLNVLLSNTLPTAPKTHTSSLVHLCLLQLGPPLFASTWSLPFCSGNHVHLQSEHHFLLSLEIPISGNLIAHLHPEELTARPPRGVAEAVQEKLRDHADEGRHASLSFL
jgi:hypothetical protein